MKSVRHCCPFLSFVRKYWISEFPNISTQLRVDVLSFIAQFLLVHGTRWLIVSILLVDSFEIFSTYATAFFFIVDIVQTPKSSTLHRLRSVLEMSNRTTPAESQSKQSDVEWKTPSKGGYPENSPRSHAMKWLKSEEALFWRNVEKYKKPICK